MLDRWLARVTEALRAKGVLTEEQAPVFQYGLESLLSSLWSYGSLVLLGAALGQFFDACLWILAYALLRQRAGGYHATTRLRCYVFSLAVGGMCMLLIRWVSPLVCLMLAVAAVASVFLLAPVQHPNHPLNPKRYARQWKLARVIACAELLAALACLFWWPRALPPLCVGMGCSALMMGVGAIAYRQTHAKHLQI